eukprot:6212517-Pleurochrysis_carterae.AAC.7
MTSGWPRWQASSAARARRQAPTRARHPCSQSSSPRRARARGRTRPHAAQPAHSSPPPQNRTSKCGRLPTVSAKTEKSMRERELDTRYRRLRPSVGVFVRARARVRGRACSCVCGALVRVWCARACVVRSCVCGVLVRLVCARERMRIYRASARVWLCLACASTEAKELQS